MKFTKLFVIAVALLALLVVPMSMTPQPATALGPYNCFPSCAGTDARFLTIAGSGLATLMGQEVNLHFAAPAGATSLEIGIFDGDTGNQWDLGTTPLGFTLYKDPNADGSGFEVVGTYDGATMPDNDWFTINVTPDTEAQSPSGHLIPISPIMPARTPVSPTPSRMSRTISSAINSSVGSTPGGRDCLT